MKFLGITIDNQLRFSSLSTNPTNFNRKPIPYDSRKGFKLFLPPARSFRIKPNSLYFRGSIIWNNLLSLVKIICNTLELCTITFAYVQRHNTLTEIPVSNGKIVCELKKTNHFPRERDFVRKTRSC